LKLSSARVGADGSVPDPDGLLTVVSIGGQAATGKIFSSGVFTAARGSAYM